ncbi:Epsin amino-terminal domain containing protein [Ceratobasidium theobromae]|uniref:Epsin amino-terminal domain containing protein n=1 Tax=Ceratobasidium theobromae TaxID=1582974 RepID=A0A5N5QI92_9AGAM|nr:Epsin amino-terminal domain containing protein [Ceratobasidium theobromae]
MSFQHLGKGALRVAKNYTKGYSDVQAKVRDATSNDPWGPSGTQMNDIAQMTYNQNDFVEIMEMLDKRLNDKGKNWRHVFKALTVLDYCLHAGSENTVIYFKDNLYVIKTLKEFQFIDEYGKDQGANVRQKAKDITNLLTDDTRLREERRSRASMRDRMVRGGVGEFGPDGPDEDAENENRRRAAQMLGASRSKTKEDDDMKRAIEESKRSLAEEQRRQGEERDLAKAIALSEQEEATRKKALQGGGALFDDQSGAGPSANGTSGGGDLLIDFNAAPPQQQLQPQFTSFNPYFQQAQQQAMQDQYLRQQAEWEAMQAQAAQQEEWQRQQMLAQQQAAQQEEWNRQQQLLFQQQQQQQQAQQQQFLMQQMQMQNPMMAQPTGYGSNNPFAMMGAPSQPSPMSTPAPSMSPFPSASSSSITQSSPSPQPSLTQKNTIANSRRPDDGANSHLAHLIANREDGMDTFGNVGQLRFGHGQSAQRLHATHTGAHNPFGQPQQGANEQPFFTV